MTLQRPLSSMRSDADLPCVHVLTESLDVPAVVTSIEPNGRVAVTLFDDHGPDAGALTVPVAGAPLPTVTA